MTISAPSEDDLRRVAERLGFGLTAGEAEAFVALSGRYLGAYDRVDELARIEDRPHSRSASGFRPTSDDNRLGGWVWKGSLRERSDGKLSGYKIAVKDNICVAGVPMLVGSRIMEGFEPERDATVVARVLDAGAEIVGKTAVPEFCFDGTNITGYPAPTPMNPHKHDHSPGGSSSGNSVVLVNGEADLALGTDTAGSIRLPASWSGCCGLKPTYGLVPNTGIFPIEMTLDHTGPMGRTVADVALLLEVIAGAEHAPTHVQPDGPPTYAESLDKGVEGLTVGVLREGFGIPDCSEPDVDEAVRRSADVFEQLGARVVEVSVPMHADGVAVWAAILFEGATAQFVWGDCVGTNWRGRYSATLAEFFGRKRAELGDSLPPTVKLTLLIGQYVSDQTHHRHYAQAQNLSRVLAQSYGQALSRVDLFVLPTAPMKACRNPHDPEVTEVVTTAWGNLQNTAPFNVSGNPALSVPCGFIEGLPVGLMIVGQHHQDAVVLRAGHALQESLARELIIL